MKSLNSLKLIFGSSIYYYYYYITGTYTTAPLPPFFNLSAANLAYNSNSSYYFRYYSIIRSYFSFSAYNNLFFMSVNIYSSKYFKFIRLSVIYIKYYGINTRGLPYKDNIFKLVNFIHDSTEYSKSHN